MDYNFNLFPDTFVGWIYFLAALILVALVIFIGRRVRRGRKSSSNSKSTRRASAPVVSNNEGEEDMSETNSQSVSKPLPPAFIWFAVCAISFSLIFWGRILMKFTVAGLMVVVAFGLLYYAVKYSNQAKYKTAAFVLIIEVAIGFVGYFTGIFDLIFDKTDEWSTMLRIVSAVIFLVSLLALYAMWQGWSIKRVEKTVWKTVDQVSKQNVKSLWDQLSSSEQEKVRRKLGQGTHDQYKWRKAIIEVMEDR